MRATITLSALALILSLAPAFAMCGGSQQGQNGTTGQAAMCGRPSAAQDDPFGLKQSKPQQQTTGMGMCPCCKGMADMKMDGDDPHKGMDMTPKQ